MNTTCNISQTRFISAFLGLTLVVATSATSNGSSFDSVAEGIKVKQLIDKSLSVERYVHEQWEEQGSHWTEAADNEDPVACFLLANRWTSRKLGNPDWNKYLAYLQTAAEGGYEPALVLLGHQYYRGLLVPLSHAKAKQLYQKAAGQGYAYANICLAPGLVEFQGKDAPAAGLEYYKKAAEAGTLLGSLDYSQALLKSGKHAKGLKQLKFASDGGNILAQYTYGTMLMRPVDKSGRELAALREQYPELFLLEEDIEKAISLFESAASQGLPNAQVRLASCYSLGKHVSEKSMSKSIEYYKQAAETGDVIANFALFDIYVLGKGVPVDKEAATEHLWQAAKQGDGVSLSLLSKYYWNGDGVPKNPILAIQLCEEAVKKGFAPAKQDLKLLQRQLVLLMERERERSVDFNYEDQKEASRQVWEHRYRSQENARVDGIRRGY